ncbi:ABC transporter permease [Actinotalea sp. K2]|nr:ABC transporter permease [Actinotalea sp. K2]
MTTDRAQRLAGGGWQAVAVHWLRKYRRVWVSTLITSSLSPLLYLAGMGIGLGMLVDRGAGGVGGVPYVVFVAPGLLAASTLQVAAGETTFSVLGSIKWTPIYHGMLATPLRVRDVVLGQLVYVLLRVTSAAIVFFVIAAALGTVRSWWGLLAVPVSVLGGMAFASCCFAYSANLRNDQGIMLMFRFVVMPMSLFSGTFFPIEQLPGWLQPVAWVTPLWHAVEACRALVLGTATVGGVLVHCAYLAVWLVGGYLLSVRVLRGRMVV